MRGTAGNVWEWCATRWSEQRFGDSIVESDLESIRGPNPISLRGGSFNFDRRYVRCAYRFWYVAGGWIHGVGFRCVRDVE